MHKRLPILASLLLGAATAALTLSGSFALSPERSNAADLQTIKKRGRLIVAVKDNSRPLGFRSADGRLQGFEIDLAQRLAEELLRRGNAVQLEPVLNQQRFEVVLNGKVDMAIAHVTLTPSRLRILSFSLPYYKNGIALVVRDSAIGSLDNLATRSIAAVSGSSAIEAVRRRLPRATIVEVPSYGAARAAVESGQAIAVAADATVLAGWVQEFPQYRLLTPLLSSESLCVVLPKGQQYDDLRQEVDQILTRLNNSGWLAERAAYWGLPRNLSF